MRHVIIIINAAHLLLRGGHEDGVEPAVLPVVLQARLVVNQLDLAFLCRSTAGVCVCVCVTVCDCM